LKRVALTTDRFEKAARHFAEAGLKPLPTPCVRMVPASTEELDQARAVAATADLIVATSARTIDLLWPTGGMPAADVAAVGPVTARAVTAAGGRVVITGRGGLADLVEPVADLGSGRLVVIVRAAGSDPVAMDRLRSTIPELADQVAYRMEPMAPAASTVDAVAFASPSAVAGWLLTRSLDRLVVGVIGDTTAAAVSPHRSPDVVADQPSFAALAETMSSFMEVST
jgi:uroporphyrinogen-III synthase